MSSSTMSMNKEEMEATLLYSQLKQSRCINKQKRIDGT